ncbi:MAG: DJ-1/PfpI family protein [Ruminococcaceae bacterium]|nr:DJ-1/PfpI family protein [Oscillospiraceae bacterium]
MVYCFLADGFEELEAIAPIDMLKRAGVEVITVGVTGKNVTGSHNITFVADITADEITLTDNLEAVILPGGMPGTINLEKSERVQQAIDFAAGNGRYLCAICAAPSILGHKGLLRERNATAFPGFEKDLEGANTEGDFVVTDGTFVTAKGAGVATEFGLEIVRLLVSEEKSNEIRKAIQSR